MGFWHNNKDEYEKMVQLIQEVPGLSQSELARKLGVSVSTIGRRLPSLEGADLLVSPLNGEFVEEKNQVATALNAIHEDRIQVRPFNSLAELADVIQHLIADTHPYAFPG